MPLNCLKPATIKICLLVGVNHRRLDTGCNLAHIPIFHQVKIKKRAIHLTWPYPAEVFSVSRHLMVSAIRAEETSRLIQTRCWLPTKAGR